MAEKRKRFEDVRGELQEARRLWPVGTLLAHKKGGTYRVAGHSFHTETQEVLIAYRRIAGPNFEDPLEQNVIYSRPLSLFTPDRFTEIR